MKKGATSLFVVLFALACVLVLWASARTPSSSGPKAAAGNIAEGMYMIVGWSSKRCLEVPNSSCASEMGLQTFECDPTEASNNQKFNVVSDGSGNYTISPVHSDLCLEVSGVKLSGRIPILQTACSPGKVSQKWAMSQYGDNLEIRDVQKSHCLDVMRKSKDDYAPIFLQRCADGTNQRWTLRKTTINVDKGVICKASASHPEHNCTGVNSQQKEVHLGKTLTKVRCEDVCKMNGMVSCKWEGLQ